MARIHSAEPHRNDNASMAFGVAVLSLRDWVRQHIAYMAKSRKADEQAPGSIHALRKLCEREKAHWDVQSSLHRSEVQEWQCIFASWYNRVNRSIPEELREQFKHNADEDFAALLEVSGDMPEHAWRPDSLKRSIKISFATEQALDESRKLADEKHPVVRGSALHEYLASCVAALHGLPPASLSRDTSPSVRPPMFSIDRHKDGVFSLIVQDLSLFQDEDLAEEAEVTAYDLEDAVRRLFKERKRGQLLSAGEFDCESSAFVFRSSNPMSCHAVQGVLLELAETPELRASCLHSKNQHGRG